jgi:glycosyltransferase involved in cell wall biosynthesis
MIRPTAEALVQVSVHMPAFNHGPYIAQALESVLRQQVSFEYEIVIGEDCSTDNTREIASDYARRFPDKIRLLLHDKNVGIFDNDQRIFLACRGQYIAWLESDDYWTSPSKLQTQVDLLDEHPEYSACFHWAGHVGDLVPVTWRAGPPVVKVSYTIDDLLAHGHFMPSCTVVFRAAAVRAPAEWTRHVPFLETTYAARLALTGHIGFIDEELAVFRYHANGIYARSTPLGNLQSAIDTHRLIGTRLHLRDRPAYRAGLARMYASLSTEYGRQHLLARTLWARSRARWNSSMPPDG